MNTLKIFFKQNTHNKFFGGLAGFGRSMNRLYENRNHNIYSNGEANLLKKISKLNPKIVFDVGANIGEYSLLAYDLLENAKIYSFEPVLEPFTILKQKVQSIDRITAFNEGLFKENATKDINLYPSHTHSSLYDIKGINYSFIGKEKIKLIEGDKFIKDNCISYIDLIKLDIEGSEMEALIGLEKSLNNNIIRLIQFEYGYINITTKNLLADYYDFFSKLNYIVGKLYPKYVEFRNYSFKYEDFIGPNFVAIHKSDNELLNIISKKK